jgi:hypothetical protein
MTIARAPLESLDYLNDTPAPGEQLEEQHDHREYDQGVNEAATYAEAKTERPQDEQNDHYGPQHKSSTSFSKSAYRVQTPSAHPLILSMSKEQTINRVDASLDVTRSGLALVLKMILSANRPSKPTKNGSSLALGCGDIPVSVR